MAKKRKTTSNKEKKSKVKKQQKYKPLLVVQDGKVTSTNPVCPRCGPGYYMAIHYDRRTCGNCKYTQFLDKDGNVRVGPSGRRSRNRPTRRRKRVHQGNAKQ
ncbi:MAG: 30S ribosomal protein S27ae [Promethearchaeota archaeon]